ncbi:hypothetical protein [Sphingobium sp. MK2]|uniref:hypothetical protein n=1 Tax=Sphingobium sp. MK2 TaxID=3116540 RepID=UPI0032E365CF
MSDLITPPTFKRRALGMSSDEVGWFAEQNITPEGDAPLASYSDLESWTAYVAWKLGDEAGLTANPDFILHCMTCRRDGKESYRAAYEWLQASRPPVPALPENAAPSDKLIALSEAYHKYMTPNELREWGATTAATIKEAAEYPVL